MPALARAKKQANMVLCQSNQRQLGVCFSMFVGDHDSYFPAGWCTDSWTPPSGTHADGYWMQALRPYYGNEHDLRCCPAAMKPGTEVGGGPFGGALLNSTFVGWGIFPDTDYCGEVSSSWSYAIACDYGSYGWNGWLGNPPSGQKVPPNLSEDHPVELNWRSADVKGTGNIPLIMSNQWIDGWPRDQDTPPEYEGQQWWISGYENMARFCLNRHDGFTNSAFLDFSTRKVGLKELWKLKWHRRFDVNADPPVWPEWMKTFKEYD